VPVELYGFGRADHVGEQHGGAGYHTVEETSWHLQLTDFSSAEHIYMYVCMYV
jgi:hypothetical protein